VKQFKEASLTDEQLENVIDLAELAGKLEEQIDKTLVDGVYGKAIALVRLEECMMWASHGVHLKEVKGEI
jgi:hypothetical protein